MNDMTAAQTAQQNNRDNGGKYATKEHAEVAGVSLAPTPTAADIEFFNENRGVFVDGYDEEAADMLAGLSSKFAVVWEYYDSAGYGGDSEFVGLAGDGVWRRMHPDAWMILNDPESSIDPSSIETLHDMSDAGVYELQNIDELGGDSNVCITDETVCRFPGCDDDGEGGGSEDGLCGHHADVRYGHLDDDTDVDPEDGHQDGSRPDECSKCAGIE